MGMYGDADCAASSPNEASASSRIVVARVRIERPIYSFSPAKMSPRLVLLIAVLATTYAGPIIRFAAAPALAIAFWRLAFAAPVTLAVWRASSDASERRSRVVFGLMVL